MGGEAAQAVRNTAKAQYYYQQAIAADPTSDYAMVMLGAEIAQNTGEHDLDKKDKLARAEKLAKDGMALVEKRAKQPQENQQQFDQEKASDIARAHMTLGLIAMADQKDEAAGNEFLQAAAGDAMNLLRAGMAFNNAKKIDQANAALDKFISIPGLPDQYKKMAEDEKKRGQQLKNAK
jgi:BarA-like signal transduction histidine kinase